ncbi:poly-beta-1,6-N-acetyl-D-glucosamine biosynthesis protein PgaD [Anaeromyxobacter oryzisoli]|uniref:poly-beta-1,6-N-acetyl-D-glucosamine biosynthesis protein PgaD n=1 Tax=Anaeromyxobacter oryzisoli TaxID=2925408 RepID=UPI001F565B38|nr:poly-beta-1,6-N-acetyl-D-glucosamine biosynthesis protein PgaD [Anaeromyxobacter sp. SG63]
MNGPLIIDARHRLAWPRRVLSDASTAVLWGAWLWLWSPILKSAAWLAELGTPSYLTLSQLLPSGSAVDLQRSVMALVGTSGTLLVWNRLPARKLRASSALSVRDYARYFGVPEHALQAGRRAAVCVVHHDDSGRIVEIECRAPAACPAAADEVAQEEAVAA